MAYVLSRRIEKLHEGVDALEARMSRLNQLSLTSDEFLALFAPPEDWDILKRASEIATVTASGGAFEGRVFHNRLPGNETSISFFVSPDDAPLMPRNTNVVKEAPKELVDRVVDWAIEAIETRIRFSRAKRLLDWLNVNCDTRAQVRFLWPSILTLCSLSPETTDLANLMGEFKAPKKLPVLPMEVRHACRDTAGAIASAMLLDPDAIQDAPPVSACLSDGAKAHRAKEGALGLIG